MSDIELRDLVACKMCSALTTREGRADHLAWHARLNARTMQPRDPGRIQ